MPETVPATSKLKNYIAIILDKSGSMLSLKNEVVGGFNDQIKNIKEQNEKTRMETLMSLVEFSSGVYPPVAWLVDIDKIELLTPEKYMPDGMTAMYDAVGLTIEQLMSLPDAGNEEVSFLIIVISDGFENNSHNYTSDKIAELVKSCEKTGRWTFTYIGANQDLGEISKRLNINIGNTMAFAATAAGYSTMTGSLVAATAGYYEARTRGVKSMSNMFAPNTTNDADKDADAQ